MLPQRLRRNSGRQHENRRFPGHRAWVRGHACCVPGCNQQPIECAHVRQGSDGGISLKPSDLSTISLCSSHHREQHDIGVISFELRYGLDLAALAAEFSRRSPHRNKWRA
jgi:hypothetical protein